MRCKHIYTPGKGKEHIRDYVFSFFKDRKRVLTLPNLYFDLESRLLKDDKQVDCCEYDKNIFIKQKKIVPKEINLYYREVGHMNLKKYDALFLDFCGPFNETTSETLIKIEPGTKVVLTFLLARESKKVQKLMDLRKREESYVRLLANFGIFVTKYINYSDKPHSPMAVFFGTKY